MLRSGTAIDALGEQCLASWWFTIEDGFNVAHLHNWDMVDEFALQIAPQLALNASANAEEEVALSVKCFAGLH